MLANFSEDKHIIMIYTVIIWLSLVSGHGAHLLVAHLLSSRALCEGNTLFYGHVSFAEKVDLNENRKALGNVCWKSSNNNRSWNIIVAFFKSCLAISEENECLILALNLNHRTVFSILQCNRRGLRVIVAGLFLSRSLILHVSFPSGFFTW